MIQNYKEKLNEFPEVFSGCFGRWKKMSAELELNENAAPLFKPKRSVPLAALNQINEELDILENINVIPKIENSNWPSPVVYIKKHRKWYDFFTGLNDVLKTYYYPLLSPQKIFTRLSNGEIFSKFDLSDTYFQILVNDECSKLLNINTIGTL